MRSRCGERYLLKKRRRRAKDKLSITEVISLDETADQATVEEWRSLVGTGFGGFEWMLCVAERIWLPYAPREDAPEEPEEHSLGWYASQILFRIRAARDAFAAQRFEEACLHALAIGRLEAEGRWRNAVREKAHYARRVRAKSLRAGRQRGRDLSAGASAKDKLVIDLAEQLRLKHPEHSTRWLAGEIGRRLNQPTETIRDRLKRLGIK